MDISNFHEANLLYTYIKDCEDKMVELSKIKDKIVEILVGHTEIPQKEIYDTFNKIDNLNKYLKQDIENKYDKIKLL